MTYLLLMDRWHCTYEELRRTPQRVIDDMVLVMEAEQRVDAEK